MGRENEDEYRVWGTDNKGDRTLELHGFTRSLDAVRDAYLKEYPKTVYLRFEIAVPDKETIAAGRTNAQLAEKARG